ncbi:HAD-IA family hydrolase [Micromonospora echinofusca]|uniref:HAD family hydrolase n=1 Tax=Micromonospora echinofusca TaxID=47858 RepID=UPI000CC84C90|nr:HAD-IA family hydrolase [Micromonospora sp. MSM11]MCL7458344.1 HAD-IA family hydrolase [Micromonospora sp. MSM11]
MTAPELVIFDLDGVLVDTQAAETGALNDLAGLMGVRLSAAEAAELFAGKRMADCIAAISDRAAAEPPPGAVELVRARCEELIGDRLEPIDGVRHVVDAVDRLMCVASNSPRELIRKRVEAAGIASAFGERLYSAYDIGSWKPAPDLFLWAARECGVPPASCVVIEDSPVGVAAAIAAGMPVLRYGPDGTPADHAAISPHLPPGTAVTGLSSFAKMADLPALISHFSGPRA